MASPLLVVAYGVVAYHRLSPTAYPTVCEPEPPNLGTPANNVKPPGCLAVAPACLECACLQEQATRLPMRRFLRLTILTLVVSSAPACRGGSQTAGSAGSGGGTGQEAVADAAIDVTKDVPASDGSSDGARSLPAPCTAPLDR